MSELIRWNINQENNNKADLNHKHKPKMKFGNCLSPVTINMALHFFKLAPKHRLKIDFKNV